MAQGRYLTLEEAAKNVGRPVSWVKNCICRGELDGKLEGRKWLVSVESLHKITPTSPPPKPETEIHDFLTPRSSRKASAEKNMGQDRSALENTRTSNPTKKRSVPVSGRKGGKAEPKPNRRQATELRIEALDKKIAWLGNLLRKEMISHGQANNSQGPEGYGKTAKKLLRQWKIAREERRKLVTVLKNLDESGRVITSISLPNVSDEEIARVPIGGITGYGYYPKRSETESAGEEATPDARLLIGWSRARESARRMQDRGTGRAAREAAETSWAQARLEAEKRKPKGTTKASARSPSPQPLSASSTSAVRAAGKGKRPSPPRDAASDHRSKTASEISRISDRMKENGHPAPLGDPASRVMLVVEQPIGPRVLQALKLSLRAVRLPEAYVTYASTGLLEEELRAIEPHALIAVGSGGARDIDATDYPLVIRSFSEAEPGVWFSWKKGTRGLLLPSLAPALDDEEAKRLFWRTFLRLKALAPTVTSSTPLPR
jgi:hypothetical protein